MARQQTTFTAETLRDDLTTELYPDVRSAMLQFVGRYLLDFDKAAHEVGLTLPQARVLGFAAAKPSSQRDIADQFGCDPSNISGKVTRLIELGLVERQGDPEDARVRLIAATDEGVAVAAQLCQSREWLATVLDGLSESEVDTVRAALHLLVG